MYSRKGVLLGWRPTNGTVSNRGRTEVNEICHRCETMISKSGKNNSQRNSVIDLCVGEKLTDRVWSSLVNYLRPLCLITIGVSVKIID